MKRIWIALLFGLLFYTGCKNEHLIPIMVTDSISSLKSKYAPDKRTSIFNITTYLSPKGLVLKGETQYPDAKMELLSAINTIPYIDSIELLPAKSLGNELYGVINIPVGNIRSNPTHSAELATQALCGSVLRLWNFKNGWVYCQTPDDYLGWIDIDAITAMDSIQLSAWNKSQKAIITADQAYITNAKSGLDIVTTLHQGAIVQIVNSGDKNYKEVAMPDGRKGFISANHLANFDEWKNENSIIPNATSLLSSAHKLLGRPYLWGGTSVNGMDCSGFTKTIFFNNGFILPRDASQQVRVGLPVDTDTSFTNLQMGDLLFFGRKASKDLPEKITHVAMYIGEGKIIHAAGYVRIQSLKRGDTDFSEERIKTFVRATRPIIAPKEHGILAVNDIKWYQ